MPDRNFYTIGWICAIHTELVAALALLDEKHDRPTELDPNDSNNYELGKISGHYIAIACLPDGEHGIAAAAGAATNLLRSFPNIRFGLMVGTGGGAPTSHHDIRLGDVVVSTPGDGKGGIFQYDFGKTMQNQAFVETGFLDQPPKLLRAAVAGLKAGYEMDGHTLTEEVNKALQRKPRLQRTYCRPQTDDILYKSTYMHVSGQSEDCAACGDDFSHYISRRPRDENDDDPVIHYGLIASANQRMENAIIRDQLATEKGVLCFEMEAAGLMNHFPCLIIRGICDYADTHRNDKWKGYASMMAAAYARDLVRRLIPEQVQARKTANEILTGQVSELTYKTDKIAYKLDLVKLSIAEGAEHGSYADQHEDECLQGTRTKILHDIEEWATSLSNKCIFWLNGMAGTGKSTISRTIAKRFREKNLLGASFFFKKGEADRGNATRFFSTIASQLQTRIPGMADDLRNVIDSEPQISRKSLKEQFERLILEPISTLKSTRNIPSILVVVIDALDECENDKDIRLILHLLPQLGARGLIQLRVFITSRPELPIRHGFHAMEANDYQDLILHQIPRADVEQDIRLFLEYKLAEIRTLRSLRHDWPGETKTNALIIISAPLFIFASTMCRVFEDHHLDIQQCVDDYLNYEAEEYKLDAVYLPVLNRICAKYSNNSKRREQFIQDVREVVSAIILLENPLPIASLSKLINIPIETINTRLTSLHSVLNVPKDANLPIRLFHLSFRDFLLDHETREKTAIWTDEKATNEKLAIQCLNIMRTCLKKNICNLPNYTVDRNDILDETIDKFLPIQLAYSCRYWVHHLSRSQDATTHLQNAQSFLETHLLHWVEAMSILELLPEVIEALKELQSTTQNNDEFGMSELLHDAIRYVRRNGMIINRKPLQLYVSGLVFAPGVSVVKRLFSAELPDFISMPHNVDGSWGAKISELEGSSYSACLAISPDGLLIAAGSPGSSTIKLWDIATATLQQTMDYDQADDYTTFSDRSTSESANSQNTQDSWIIALAFSPDSEVLVSCSEVLRTGKIHCWDTTTGILLRTFDDDVHRVTSLVFTDCGRLLASPSKTWDFLIWDHVTGIQHYTLAKRLPEDANVALSSNGVLLASDYDDTSIDLWNLVTCNLQHTLMGHTNRVTHTAFSTDGRLLASGDQEGTIILWNTATGVQQRHIMKHVGAVSSISFSPGDQLLASSHVHAIEKVVNLDSPDHPGDDIALWDLDRYSLIRTLGDNFWTSDNVLFSPTDKTLASAQRTSSGPIRLWDTAHISQDRQPHSSDVIAAAFSLDGHLLASICRAGIILIWNVISESIIENLGHKHPSQILAFSPDNKLLAFCSSHGVMELWNLNTKLPQYTFEALGSISCVAFSPDGQLISCGVIARNCQDIKIWDLTTGILRQTIRINASRFDRNIESLSFSPNCQLLAASAPGSFRGELAWLIKIFHLYNELEVTTASRDFTSHISNERAHLSSVSMETTYAIFYISDRKVHFNRDEYNRMHDFPVFHLWNAQGGFDRNHGSKWCYDQTNDEQNGLEIMDEWLYYRNKRVLWFPSSYRVSCWASNNKTIAIGYASGGVTIIKLSPPSDYSKF